MNKQALDDWIMRPDEHLQADENEPTVKSALKPLLGAHWAVEVKVDGERILNIESNSMSGIENIEDYKFYIQECASALLSFIGHERT